MNLACFNLLPKTVGTGLAGVGLCAALDHVQNACEDPQRSQAQQDGQSLSAHTRAGQPKTVTPRFLQACTNQSPAFDANARFRANVNMRWPMQGNARGLGGVKPFQIPACRFPVLPTIQTTAASCAHQSTSVGVTEDVPEHGNVVQHSHVDDLRTKAKLARQLKGELQKEFVVRMQNAFRQGLSREQALNVVQRELNVWYEARGKPFGLSNKDFRFDTHAMAKGFPDFEVMSQGSKLPKVSEGIDADNWDGDASRLGRHTIIRDSDGRCHSLITTVYPDEAQALRREGHAVGVGKVALGAGGSGIVRIARDDAQSYEAVKKITHLQNDPDPAREIEILKKIKKGDHLVRYRGSAQIRQSKNVLKSYVFMDIAGQLDGQEAALLRAERAQDPSFDQVQYVDDIGKQYIQAVAELHAQGIYHCDLKLENFSHFLDSENEQVKLIDFGAATDDEFELSTTATRGFIPPELWVHFPNAFTKSQAVKNDSPHNIAVNLQSSVQSKALANKVASTPVPQPTSKSATKPAPVSNLKRDAWALGMALLCWRLGEDPDLSFRPSLRVTDHATGETFNMPLHFKNRECVGLCNTDRYAGATWDEVIAKFLDVDPDKRPTPAQVLQFPLFQK